MDRSKVFLAVFLFEAVIKICALQEEYFRSWWNLFDLFIVVVSVVDLFLTAYNFNLTVIRSMRLVRHFLLKIIALLLNPLTLCL